MRKVKDWVGIVTAPILMASVGCAIGQRPFAETHRGISPERMMAMGQAFERQGHYDQAKYAYIQVLQVQPTFPEAQKSLDTLVAKETKQNELRGIQGVTPSYQMAGRVQPSIPNVAHQASAIQNHSSQGSIDPILFVPQPLNAEPSKQGQPNYVGQPATPSQQYDQLPPANPARQESRGPEGQTSYPQYQLRRVDSTPTFHLQPMGWAIPSGSQAPYSAPNQFGQLPQSTTATPMLPQTSISFATPPSIVSVAPSVSISESRMTLRSPANDLGAKIKAKSRENVIPVSQETPAANDAPVQAANHTIEVAGTSNVRHETETDDTQITNPELRHYFGTFQIEMIARLKSRRVALQQPLVSLAADRSVPAAVRSRAIFLLGAIGPEATDAVPSLRQLMIYEPDAFVRIDLAESILKIQPGEESATRSLVDCLRDPEPDQRWLAAMALRNSASEPSLIVIESLQQLLPTADPKLKRIIFLTLAEFGPASASAIPELEAALESPDPKLREIAKTSLAAIAPDRKGMTLVR